MTVEGNKYWQNLAYKTGRFGEIYKPNQNEKLNTAPLLEVRSFFKTTISNLKDIDGDILDIGGGVNTGFYFNETTLAGRKLILADIAKDVYRIITEGKVTNTLPSCFKTPDLFVGLDLNLDGIRGINIPSARITLAAMIDTARYIKDESLFKILEQLKDQLVVGGQFVLVDFERMNIPEAEAMGEVRPLNGEANDLIMDQLEEFGYQKVEFVLIREENNQRFTRFAIIGTNPG